MLITEILSTTQHFAELATDVQNSELFTILIQVAAYITPYFLIPATFKFGLGVFGNLAGMINDRSRGFFDRNRKFRGAEGAKKRQAHMEGKSWIGSGSTGRGYRRVATGNFGLTARQRRKFGANETAITARAVEEGLKNDGGRAFADDDATIAALHATSSNDFIHRYTSRTGRSEAEAKERLGALEVGLGAKIGSRTMQASAYRARVQSSKGYEAGDDGLKEMYGDGARLLRAGVISAGDMAQTIKSSKARPDYSASYGAIFQAIDEAQRVTPGSISDTTVKGLRRSAISGLRPGELLSGHPDAVRSVAPVMLEKLMETMDTGDQVAIDQELASLAGRYDTMSQIAPDSAKIMAEGVLAKTVVNADGTSTTVRQLIEDRRNQPHFLNMRREYGAAEGRARLARGAEGGDPGQPPIPGL